MDLRSHGGFHREKNDSEARRQICFFWDIENVRVPGNLNAKAVAKKLRDTFVKNGFSEYEFYAACDCTRERKSLLGSLNDAEVSVLHTDAFKKNSADSKLRSSMRRTASKMKEGDKIVLITSDIDFAPEVREIRYTHLINVILIHNRQVSGALINFADEHYCLEDLVEDIPAQDAHKNFTEIPNNNANRTLLLSNLPPRDDAMKYTQLEYDVQKLSGRFYFDGAADKRRGLIRFSTPDACLRAKTRFENYFINGLQVIASFPPDSELLLHVPKQAKTFHAEPQLSKKAKKKKNKQPHPDSVERFTSGTRNEPYFPLNTFGAKGLPRFGSLAPASNAVLSLPFKRNRFAAPPPARLASPQKVSRYVPHYMQPQPSKNDCRALPAQSSSNMPNNFEFGRGTFGAGPIFANAASFNLPEAIKVPAAQAPQVPRARPAQRMPAVLPSVNGVADDDSDIEVISVKTNKKRVRSATKTDDVVVLEMKQRKKSKKGPASVVGSICAATTSTIPPVDAPLFGFVENICTTTGNISNALCTDNSSSAAPPCPAATASVADRRLVGGFPV